MGLFDKRESTSNKKKKDDFDSPVEQIDLSAPAPAPAAEPMAAVSGSIASSPEPEPEPMREPEPPPSRYGINDAIELMRALPPENVELVVQVVKRTLESTNVKVSTIIDDASAKQKRIEDRIAVLKGEIADFEKEIDTRRGEIGSLEADHEETSTVKDRLMLAEKLVSPNGANKAAAPAGANKSATKTSESGSSVSGTTSARPATPAPAASTSKTTIVAKK